MLKMVTMTGADDTIAPSEVIGLSRVYPFVEWAILVSKRHLGATRFPSREWLDEFAVNVAQNKSINVSCHICGEWVRQIVRGTDIYADMEATLGKDFLNVVNRFQLNFHAEPHPGDADKMCEVLNGNGFAGRQIIFQVDDVNNALLARASFKKVNCVPLFDLSHGTGVLPANWPSADVIGVFPRYGYAGGLGPDCLVSQVSKIKAASNGLDYWVDMESKIRTVSKRDFFSLSKVVTCLNDVKGLVK